MPYKVTIVTNSTVQLNEIPQKVEGLTSWRTAGSYLFPFSHISIVTNEASLVKIPVISFFIASDIAEGKDGRLTLTTSGGGILVLPNEGTQISIQEISDEEAEALESALSSGGEEEEEDTKKSAKKTSKRRPKDEEEEEDENSGSWLDD